MRYLSITVTFMLVSLLLTDCTGDDRLATTMNSRRKPLYAFFNDIRLAIDQEFPNHPHLPEFMDKTKTHLESKEAQGFYKIGGMYYEHNLNRKEGAYEYEDRFFENGCIIHVVLYPPEQELVWENLQGYNKGAGKQIGPNFLFYQVFSAQPTDEAFEARIVEIITNKLSQHAEALAKI